MNEKLEEQEVLLKKIVKLRKSLVTRIEKLKRDPNVQKYINLTRDLIRTDKDYEEVEFQYMLTTYQCCEHLFAVSESEYDYYEGRTYRDYGCLKCGLDTHLYDSNLNARGRACSEYIRHSRVIDTNNTGLYYKNYGEFLKGRKLYSEYKEKYQDLDDKQIIRLMKDTYEKENKIKNNVL